MLVFDGPLRTHIARGLRPRRLTIIWDNGRLIAVKPEQQFIVDIVRDDLDMYMQTATVGFPSGPIWTKNQLSEPIPAFFMMEKFIYQSGQLRVTGEGLQASSSPATVLGIEINY